MSPLEKIETKLERIRTNDQYKQRKKITILGGGIAGLVAAFELGKLGHEIVLYEASERLGGRAYTHHFQDGSYHEFGAMRFHKTHDYTRYYAAECGIKFRKFVNHHDDPDTYYTFQGMTLKHSEWEEKLLPFLDLSENERYIIKNGPIPPQAHDQQLLNLFVQPLTELKNEVLSRKEDVDALLGTGPMTDRIAQLDIISLEQYLRKYLNTETAVSLIGTITCLEVLWDRAVTFFLREEILDHERTRIQKLSDQVNTLEEIVGGTSCLIDGLKTKIERLKNVSLNLQHSILSIKRQKSSNIQITIASKLKDKFIVDCEIVICTLPFSILRTIELTGLTKEKLSSIRNIDYTSSIKVLLNSKERFWELNNNIVGGASQTDGINRQIIYPSDNASISTSSEMSNLQSVSAQFDKIESKNVKNVKKSTTGAALVGSYCWGQDARRLGSLSSEDIRQSIIKSIENIHPEIIGQEVFGDCVSMFWDKNPFIRGGFSFLKPGDFTKYYTSSVVSEGSLHFAGEHCSVDNGWIQGAILSSLNSVEKITTL